MIPRPGLCIDSRGKPCELLTIPFKSHRAKVAPIFFLSPDPYGYLALCYVQHRFFSVALEHYHGRWMTTEHYIQASRHDAIARQKTKPWKYHYDRWNGVKVAVLPRTDPDGLVVDSNASIVVERKERLVGEVLAIPGAVLIRGGPQIDCDYEALSRIIGHIAAREVFKKHHRAIA